MGKTTRNGNHYKPASLAEKRRPRKKGLVVLACLLAAALTAGVAALAVPMLLQESEPTVFTKTIHWWDNNASDRPTVGKYPTPALFFTYNGTQYSSEEHADDPEVKKILKSLDMDGWPKVVIEDNGNNTWALKTHPAELGTTVYQVGEDGNLEYDENDNLIPTEETVTWSLGFPDDVEDYTAIYQPLADDMFEGQFGDVGENDWHYIRDDTYTFTIDLRSGSLENLEGITQAILKQFELEAEFLTPSGGQNPGSVTLEALSKEPGYATVLFQVKNEGDENWTDFDPNNQEQLTQVYDEMQLVLVMPEYTVEGYPITYKVVNSKENQENGDHLDYSIPGLSEDEEDKDDYFAIKYDNTNATNHGNATDGVYSGGSVILTLTGTTDYKAQKVWQDAARPEGTERPQVTLELWRYLTGESLESAAAVRDSAGNVYSFEVPTGTESNTPIEVRFHEKNEPDGEVADLPKYDPEGNRYIYVVKEYCLSGEYTQVFGEIDENGVAQGDFIKEEGDDGIVDNVPERPAGNTYLYNGGTLNNVLNGSTEVTATKVWNASAFQAEFAGVSVQLTLKKSSDGENWETVTEGDAPVTREITGFQAENLAGLSHTESFPQYDNLGRQIYYRWVESGVTQKPEDGDPIDTEFKIEDEKATFTLQQRDSTGKERYVRYTSESKPDGEGNTTITNSVADTMDYEVDKWWALTEDEVAQLQAEGKLEASDTYTQVGGQWYTKDISATGEIVDDKADSATFYLYRVESGQPVPVGQEGAYYLAFTMYKDKDPYLNLDSGKVKDDIANDLIDEDDIQIERVTDGEGSFKYWDVKVTGLPEFDEGGRQYDYVLVEQGRTPEYETTRTDTGYETTVYNPRTPGKVLQILVQKNWIDDSDTVHREPVTIQAYDKNTGEPIEGASVTLKEGVWNDWITIRLNDGTGTGENPESGESGENALTGGQDDDLTGGAGSQGDDTQTGGTGGQGDQTNDPAGGENDLTGGQNNENDQDGQTVENSGSDQNETEKVDPTTREDSQVGDSLLSTEAEELAAPGNEDNPDVHDEYGSDGSTGDTGDTKPTGVTGIDDIFLLEVSVGEGDNPADVTNVVPGKEGGEDKEVGENIPFPEGAEQSQIVGDVLTQYHRYRVTYSDFTEIDNDKTRYSATVINRRLGNIDIAVHKVWNSGDNDEVMNLRSVLANAAVPDSDQGGLSLALRLRFHESMGSEEELVEKGYVIEESSDGPYDYVRLGAVGSGAEETIIYNVERKTGDDVPSDQGFPEGTDKGSSVIKIDLPSETNNKEQTYYFNNLPKYDTSGTIVRYTVEEGLMSSETGKFYTFEEYFALTGHDEELEKALQNWSCTVVEGEYYTALDQVEALPQVSTKDVDLQNFDATNSLTGTKDVNWYKRWKDDYRDGQDQRPDIYLDIFRQVHYMDGDTEKNRLELYQKDYRWIPTEENGEPVDAQNEWTATFEGLPKYDSLGYEITYFAVERAVGDTALFDYAPVRYYAKKGNETDFTLLGDRITVDDTENGEETYACALKDQNDDDVPCWDCAAEEWMEGENSLSNRYAPREVNYALAEEGLFENTLQANPNLAGSKLWQGVESGYPDEHLPQVTFTLDRQAVNGEPGELEENIATLKVNWANTTAANRAGGVTTNFRFFLEGVWEMSKEDDLYVYTYAGDGDLNTEKIYVNENWEVVDATGETPADLPTDVTRLPQYNEEGRRYSYTMKEHSITLQNPDYAGEDSTDPESYEILLDPETGKPMAAAEGGNTQEAIELFESIFSSAQIVGNSFQATNVYNADQAGQLAVEKWIDLGDREDIKGYPAIQVTLYRAVPAEGGEETQWLTVDTYTWTPAEVEDAFETLGDGGTWAKLTTHTFEGLPIYSPNGEKFIYKVVETTGEFLSGYTTWADDESYDKAGGFTSKLAESTTPEEGKILQATAVEDLTAKKIEQGGTDSPDTATFINQRSPGGVKLKGEKFWDDWNDQLGLRPDSDGDPAPITLTLTRSANAQEGMGNPIGSKELKEGEDFQVKWKKNKDGKGKETDTWTFTITGLDEDGKETQLEQYAPNGMPWIYKVTEKVEESLDGIYTPSTPTLTFGTEPEGGYLTANSETAQLKNTLKTSVKFQKKWQDEENNPIAKDYFGDVTVEYTLQAAFAGTGGQPEGGWQDANTFFTNNKEEVGGAGGTGTGGDTGDTGEPDEPGGDPGTSPDGGIDGDLNNPNDGENTPQAYVPEDVLKVGTDGYEFMRQKEGKVTGSLSDEFEDLPLAVKVGEEPNQETKRLLYRVVETKVTLKLPGQTENTVVTVTADKNTDSYQLNPTNSILKSATLTSSSNIWTTTNTLKTVDLTITKKWQNDSDNKYGTRPAPVQNKGDNWEVAFVIEYNDADNPSAEGYNEKWQIFKVDETTPLVYVSGAKEKDEGMFTVEGLPYVPDRVYRATELNPGYEPAEPEKSTVDRNETGATYSSLFAHNYEASYVDTPEKGGDCSTTVTNKMETTQVTVTKNWQPKELPEGENHPSVTFQLYYVTEWDDNGEKPLEKEEIPQTEITLPIDGSWMYQWNDLPKFYPGDKKLPETTGYWVEEASSGNYVQVGEIVRVIEEDSGYATFTLTNKPVVNFTVQKQWNSVPNAARTWEVTVGLYRTTEEGFDPATAGEMYFTDDYEVTGAEGEQLTATLGPGNAFEATFKDLDKYCMDEDAYDDYGKPYTYYVRELKVNGADVKDGNRFTATVGEEELDFTVDYDYTDPGETGHPAATITNRVEGSITVEKTWWDEGGTDSDSRPDSITVGLYRLDPIAQDYKKVEKPDGTHYTVELEEDNGWKATFTDLPEYYNDGEDGDPGTKIQYKVYEMNGEVPIKGTADSNTLTVGGATYTVYYEGYQIHNLRTDDLVIEKKIEGHDANQGEMFHFDVVFTYPNGYTLPQEIQTYTYKVYEESDPDPDTGAEVADKEVGSGTIPSENDEVTGIAGTIALTGGQYAVIEGLPAGTQYTVTEREAGQAGYVTTVTGGDSVNGLEASGTITLAEDDEDHVLFTNTRNPGALTIQKTVTGSRGDKTKEWTFYLLAENPYGVPVMGEIKAEKNGEPVKLFFEEMVDDEVLEELWEVDDGPYFRPYFVATFTLKSGESLTIDSFLNGTKSTVIEKEAGEDGYTTTVSGTGTVITEGNISNGAHVGMDGKIDSTKSNTVHFENNKPGGGPGPRPTPGPEETPAPGPEETPTPSPEESPTPSPEESPTPSPGPSESPSPEPGESPTPSPEGTPTPAPSGSPSPEPTDAPTGDGTPTPAPSATPPGGGDPDDTPQTGDPTRTLWWALAGTGALAGLGVLWLTRSKGGRARHMKK